MKSRFYKFLIVVFILCLYPVISGCLTDIPFDIKSGYFNITLSDIDTYKETKVNLPPEATNSSSIIENGVLEYKIENLSNVDTQVILYIGNKKDLQTNGTKILVRNIPALGTVTGTVTGETLIHSLKSKDFYIGVKTTESANLAINCRFIISGSYNIIRGIYSGK